MSEDIHSPFPSHATVRRRVCKKDLDAETTSGEIFVPTRSRVLRSSTTCRTFPVHRLNSRSCVLREAFGEVWVRSTQIQTSRRDWSEGTGDKGRANQLPPP